MQNDSDEIMEFPDHHQFTESDVASMIKWAGNKPIITTEKDFVRLREHQISSPLFYLPIKTTLIADGNQMDQIILNYVGKSTRNR